MVFLHAAVCDKRMWQHQMKAVAASGHQLVVYDRRGHVIFWAPQAHS
ncbi:hypothetical protein [Acidovorax sp. ACV01]|nr:hypothetical protein [Acidovorax sp. ACV01]MBD9392553.1 hypothetical protein [Acidovorax sp. ACV01]